MKLKRLVENIYGKFWWMNPNGNLQRVIKLGPDTGHREAAIQLLQAMGKVPDKDVFKQMYDLGWVRVAYLGDRGTYVIEFSTNFDKEPSARQIDALKDLASETNAFEIRNSNTKKTYAFGNWE